MGSLGKTLELAFVGHPDAEFDRAYVDSIPYASMIMKIGKGPKSLLIHSRTNHQDIQWIAADYSLYVTRHGRLVKTANLPINRVGYESRFRDPVWQIQQGLAFNSTYEYQVDFQPGNFFSTEFHSTFEYDGDEVVQVLDQTYQTKRYVERFFSKKLDWEGENYFWFDSNTGVLRQTLQYSDPKTPVFLTQNTQR